MKTAKKPLDQMTFSEARTEFRNIIDELYIGLPNKIEAKIDRLRSALGPDVKFAAYGGDETPELELACLEYTFIASKLD